MVVVKKWGIAAAGLATLELRSTSKRSSCRSGSALASHFDATGVGGRMKRRCVSTFRRR